MRLQKISVSFSHLSDPDFETKAKLIVSSITGNPNLPDPTPTMESMQSAVAAYSQALVDARKLGRDNVAVKDAAREGLTQMLVQLGGWVSFVSNGDVTMLTSSGYTLIKTPQPRYISNPGVVTLTNGISSGEMQSAVPTVAGSNGYLHQICTEPPTEATVWTSHATTRCKYTFVGLIPGQQYWVRVAVTGSRQQIAYSPVANMFAQ